MTDGTGSHGYSYGNLDELLSQTTTYTGLSAQTISYAFYPDLAGSAGCIDIGGGIHGDSTTNFVRDELRRDPDGIVEVNIFPARSLAGGN
jgi:hypothetical protein